MKKTFGYILISLGGFVALTLLGQAPTTLKKIVTDSETYGGNSGAYMAGAITALVLMAIFATLFIFFGLRLLKKVRKEAIEKKEIETIAEK